MLRARGAKTVVEKGEESLADSRMKPDFLTFD